MYVPGALEEMLAGKMEGETLDDTWGILFAALVVIPLVVAVGLTLLVSDRMNRYLNLVAGPGFGLLSALPVTEILEGTFDGHVVMALTARVAAHSRRRRDPDWGSALYRPGTPFQTTNAACRTSAA